MKHPDHHPAGWARLFLGAGLALGLAAAPAAAGPASDLLTDGKAALEDELYDLAQKKIEQGLKTGALTPAEQLESEILLAQALHGQKRYRNMLDLLAAGKERAAGTAQAAAFDYWIALAHFELGEWGRALNCLADFEQRYPLSPYQPRGLRLRAWSCLRLGRQAEAIACFTRFAERYGNSPEGPANLLDGSKALIAAGQLETARNVLETLAALERNDRIGQEGRSLLGRVYAAEKKWDAARKTVQPLSAGKNVPDELRAAAFFVLADVAEAQSNRVEALGLLDQCAGQAADPALKREVNLRKGRLLLAMGKIDEGVALVRGFVAAQSTNAAARSVQLQLAEDLLARGLNEKALAEFQNFLETFSDPDGVFRAQLGKGWALARLERQREAAAAFELAWAGAPPEMKAYCRFKVADAHFAGEQFKLAAESYAQVGAQDPGTDLAEQALLQSAECRARAGELDSAERLFWEAADLDGAGPLAARALLRAAELRQQQGAEAEARAVYRLVLAEGDRGAQARALAGLAFLDYRRDRFQEALAGFSSVSQSAPGSQVADLAAYMAGWCHSRLGRPDRAEAAFRDCIRRFPDSPWAAAALFRLAEQDYNRGQYAPAEAGWIRLAREYPQAALADQALFWAGRAALKLNEFQRARDHFSLLIKNYPSSDCRPEARFYQGEALMELGEFAGAILLFDEIIRQAPDSELAEAAWFRKGDSQFTLGAKVPQRYAEALASYQRVLERPRTSELSRLQAEYKIGRCLEKSGRPADAFEHYMKAIYGYFKDPGLKPRGNLWFVRAAFNAAAIKEDEKSWRKAVAVYQRIVEARVAASRDAQERIDKIRADHWMYFY